MEKNMSYQDEVLALQELDVQEQVEIEMYSPSTPVCVASIGAVSAITVATINNAWSSGLTWGCG